jgi:hypothetical protein
VSGSGSTHGSEIKVRAIFTGLGLDANMEHKRITREDSRKLIRQRPVDAAQALISKQGFAVTSVDDIAAAVGYTRSVLFDFGSKDDLFIDLLGRDNNDASRSFCFLPMISSPSKKFR